MSFSYSMYLGPETSFQSTKFDARGRHFRSTTIFHGTKNFVRSFIDTKTKRNDFETKHNQSSVRLYIQNSLCLKNHIEQFEKIYSFKYEEKYKHV